MVKLRKSMPSQENTKSPGIITLIRSTLHAYHSSLLISGLNLERYDVHLASGILYSALWNVSLAVATLIIIRWLYNAPVSICSSLIVCIAYMIIHILYFILVSLIHRIFLRGLTLSKIHLVYASSLTYLPIIFFIAELGYVRSDLLILATTAISSTYISRAIVNREKDQGLIFQALQNLYVVLMEYVAIHFYKNTAFYLYYKIKIDAGPIRMV